MYGIYLTNKMIMYICIYKFCFEQGISFAILNDVIWSTILVKNLKQKEKAVTKVQPF